MDYQSLKNSAIQSSITHNLRLKVVRSFVRSKLWISSVLVICYADQGAKIEQILLLESPVFWAKPPFYGI